MLNQVKVSGKLVRDVYVGNGKTGPYVACTLEVPDGKFSERVDIYGPSIEAVNVFRGAQIGEQFEVHGSLTGKKRTLEGVEVRLLQVKAERAFKMGAPAKPHSVDNGYITDDDIAF